MSEPSACVHSAAMIRASFTLPLLALCLAHSVFAAEKRPNILFAIADDWGPHASAYGVPWVSTPNFDRVAKNGLLFNRAYTPNAKCAPSRACILTGRNSWQLKEAANHIPYFPPEFKGWAEALNEHGWFVGHTMKGWGPGIANDAAGKPRLMTGTPFSKAPTPPAQKSLLDQNAQMQIRLLSMGSPEGADSILAGLRRVRARFAAD